MRIRDWSSDVCSSDLDRQGLLSLWHQPRESVRRWLSGPGAATNLRYRGDGSLLGTKGGIAAPAPSRRSRGAVLFRRASSDYSKSKDIDGERRCMKASSGLSLIWMTRSFRTDTMFGTTKA